MLKNGKVFLVLLLISFLFALLAGGNLPYLIFKILALIFLFSFMSVRINKKNLACFFYIDKKDVMVGDSLALGYKLNNTSILPIAYGEIDCQIATRLGNRAIPGEIRMIHPLELIHIQRQIQCIHRGTYPIGRLHLKIRDLFHFFEESIDFDNQLELKVYPRIIQIEKMNIPAAEFFGNVRVPQNTHEDYSSVVSIRKYRAGDPVKKIHWKATAKNGNLYVKNYELSANARILFIIDGYHQSYRNDIDGMLEEKVIEAAGSMMRYCLSKDLDISLARTWGERNIISGKGIAKFQRFLTTLMDFIPEGNLPLEKVLEREKSMVPWGTTLIVLAVDLTKGICDEILSLRRKRMYVVLVLIKSKQEPSIDINEHQEESILREKNVIIHKVYLDSDIRKILEDEPCIQSRKA